MDAGRFAQLYSAEAKEHLGLLSRSLLALESPTVPADAVGEAFRAAHTLKGVAAAMGHETVAELAHAIEDRLDAVRSGRTRVDPELVDALLGAVDALEVALESSLRPAPPPGPRRVRVVLREDTQLMGARAVLIATNLKRRGLATGTDPETFGDSFDGTFSVLVAQDAATDDVSAAILAAGDVERLEWEDANAPHGPKPPPASYVRVDASRLDTLADGIGELTVLHARALGSSNLPELAGDRVALLLSALQDEVLRLRMQPVSTVFDRLPRAVRDAARAAGRTVDLTLEGGDIELDRAILDALADPLLHLVRNAVDHGIEPPIERAARGKPIEGQLFVVAERERSSVRVSVRDDGRGVPRARIAERAAQLGLRFAGDEPSDEELLRVLAQPGFSMADSVTSISGRGVGLDVVTDRVRAIGGALSLQTGEGRGTTFTLRVPITLALAQALRVRVGGEDYAIPLTHVTEAMILEDVLVSAVAGREAVRVRDDLLPLIRLRQVLGVPAVGAETAAVVAEIGERRAALAVDELLGREQILIKGFDNARGALPIFSGATLLADGRPALVLDPLSVV